MYSKQIYAHTRIINTAGSSKGKQQSFVEIWSRNLEERIREIKTVGSKTHSYLLTYLLTYYMEQSPSSEANRFAAHKEIPSILWNPKVHYHIQLSLP